MGVRRHQVGEEAVSFLDAVVVVRNRFAWFDDAVLSGCSVRRRAAREPRGVESHLVSIVFPGKRRDVPEGPIAALLCGDCLAFRVRREVEDGKDRGGHGGGDSDDAKRCVRGFRVH